MKDYGCGAKLQDGLPCTSLHTTEQEPFLCDVCTEKLAEAAFQMEEALKLIAHLHQPSQMVRVARRSLAALSLTAQEAS